MGVLKRKIEVPAYIDSNCTVTLKSLGNIKEICITNRYNSSPTILPISKEEYIVLSTGEVKQVQKHAKNRAENIRNLEKTMKNLSDLINANINLNNYNLCRFITLTYKNNEQDCEKVYRDFKNFNKRFKRLMKNQGYDFEYIVTIEAQERGALHLHSIVIFKTSVPFIDNKILSEIWGNGFTSVKKLNGKPDILGRYLTAYLSNMPIEESSDISLDLLGGNIKETDIDGKNKRIIKGARLKLLPVGVRLYRYSNGIKKPIVKTTTYGEALNELSKNEFSKVGEYAIEIKDTERDFETQYIKQTYKKYINKERSVINEKQS